MDIKAIKKIFAPVALGLLLTPQFSFAHESGKFPHTIDIKPVFRSEIETSVKPDVPVVAKEVDAKKPVVQKTATIPKEKPSLHGIRKDDVISLEEFNNFRLERQMSPIAKMVEQGSTKPTSNIIDVTQSGSTDYIFGNHETEEWFTIKHTKENTWKISHIGIGFEDTTQNYNTLKTSMNSFNMCQNMAPKAKEFHTAFFQATTLEGNLIAVFADKRYEKDHNGIWAKYERSPRHKFCSSSGGQSFSPSLKFRHNTLNLNGAMVSMKAKPI